MPIETQSTPINPADASVAAAYIAETRNTLRSSLAKIEHCLNQLSDEDLWWRPFESANSLQNIVLHLCGNLRQWIIAALTDAPDTRNRAGEFADRSRLPKAELMRQLRDTVEECDRVLASFDTSRLLRPKVVQTFNTTLMAAIFDTVSHFVGHTHQIVYITRLRLGERYEFQFVPTKEQGGA
jgi:hypothetical protein